MGIFYFLVATLSWGFTWYAIKIHVISEVAIGQSIGYRFLLGFFLIYIFCRVKKIPLSYTWREHLVLAGQGLCMYSLNFYCSYFAMGYIPSGLVAIACSSFVFMNALNNRLFFKIPISFKTILGGCMGFCGIFLVFVSNISVLKMDQSAMVGLFLCLVGTYIASLGSVLEKYRNDMSKKSFLQNLTLVIFYGSIFSIGISLAQGNPLTFSFERDYIEALLYLSIVSFLLGFTSYQKAISLIGSDKAAYAVMISRIIALVLSSFTEGVALTLIVVIGAVLTLLGDGVVLTKPEKKQTV